jgi:hypothetical protein
MKVDHNEQVNQLFQHQALVKQETVDMPLKKLLYKLISDNKDKMNKVTVD